jgi:hypothetical protein
VQVEALEQKLEWVKERLASETNDKGDQVRFYPCLTYGVMVVL